MQADDGPHDLRHDEVAVDLLDDDIEDEIDGDEEDRNPRSERSLGK